MGRNQQQKGGYTYARKTGTQPYANSTGHSQRTLKTIGAVTALGLGAPPQNTMFSGITGRQGLTQPSSLDSLFGSTGLNPLAGGTGWFQAYLQLTVGQTSCSSLLSLEVCNGSLFIFSLFSS